MFLTLIPGETYDLYGDDELFLASLRDWEVKLPHSCELEQEVIALGLPYHTKRGCACSGGRLNIYFPGVEIL